MRAFIATGAVIGVFALLVVGGLQGSSGAAVLAQSQAPSCSDGNNEPASDSPAKGHYSQAQIAALWVEEGGAEDQRQVAGAVGMAESGGDPHVVNSIGASGLMQIHPPEPGVLDPHRNMRIAVRKYTNSKRSHGDGWLPWETYTNGDYLQYMHGEAPPLPNNGSACDSAAAVGSVEGTPKHIIDTVVLPIANRDGVARTVAENDAANAAHGPTVSGGRSDHQGPPDVAWAADMSNGVTTPEEDKLAQDLARHFGIPWTGAGLVSAVHNGYRFQLIYKTYAGGNHYNHVHFGVRRGV